MATPPTLTVDITVWQFLKYWLLPPGALLLALAGGLLLLRRHRRAATVTLTATVLIFWLLSTPWIAAHLLASLEQFPPLTQQDLRSSPAQAIVILAGGYHDNAPEYGGSSVSGNTLLRLNYGVRLHRLTGLPILVSGGNAEAPRPAEAELMANTLISDYQIKPRWLELNSRNSAENARFSSQMLAAAGIRQIYLVSQAWHLPRVVPQFERQGLTVIPAPTGFEGPQAGALELKDFIPSARALQESYYALHEMLGSIWYRLRYS